jgi:hypothetical protein
VEWRLRRFLRDEPANEHRVPAIDAKLIGAVEVRHGNPRQLLERNRWIEQLSHPVMLRASARSVERTLRLMAVLGDRFTLPTPAL